MNIKEQLEQFVVVVEMMPRDELAAYSSILVGLLFIIIAILIW